MNHLTTWLSGIGILIFVYLVLNKGEQTVEIIKVISTNAVSGIKALQGRD